MTSASSELVYRQSYTPWALCNLDKHPIALALLQYSAAATQAAIVYLLSATWTLLQSLAWIITAEGLDWIQTLGPMILQWDSFLLGAIFLTMSIDLDLLDEQLYPNLVPVKKRQQQQQQKQQQHQYHEYNNSTSRTSSRSSNGSSSSSQKRVTFDEQVMVLGAAAQRSVHRISTVQCHNISSSRSNSSIIDPSVPLSESPTRTTSFYFPVHASDHVLAEMRQEEAEHHMRAIAISKACSGVPIYFESPSSSPSNSCRSSICSVSSENSDRDISIKPARSASIRLASLFHPHTTDRKTHSHSKSSLVQRIMHPHQHKREIEQQQQQQQQQQQHDHGTLVRGDSISSSDSEYQPGQHQRKTLIQRLGLKKKSLT
ncbi:hypothetical protein EDD11_007805 [Mortierella claussenii]|nr:hypothetical protein EDD11_007805 [Mortierella claussenii]